MTDKMPGAKQPLPEWYQQRDMNEVFRRITAGEFCEILGVGSAGKSNFIRHLTSTDVKRRYLGENEPYFVFVLLNPHLMVNVQGGSVQHGGGAWPGYEIMLSRLRRELIDLERRGGLPTLDDDDDLITRVRHFYGNMFKDLHLIAQSGIRHLEDAVYEVLLQGGRWHIVFLFDEIEEFMRVLPPEFFQSLRGLRDEFKGRVMYVTTSRLPLVEIAHEHRVNGEAMVMEGFVELFNGFQYHLGLLEDPSAREAIRRLEVRNRLNISEPNRQRLLQASGKHAGLLRRAFVPTMRADNRSIDDDGYYKLLLGDRGVRQECRMIFDSLRPDEQAALLALTTGRSITPDSPVVRSLLDKHLIIERDGSYYHALPILAGHLKDLGGKRR
jgi:hypothetical protein